MPSREKLAEFTARCAKHIRGDEKAKPRFSSTGSFKVSVNPVVST